MPEAGRSAACGHPTRRGGLCQNPPMVGSASGRCYQHQGIASTEAEVQASRENPIKHGYFVTGFLDDDERALFGRVLEGEIDPGVIKREVIAALVVRAARLTKWEADEQAIAGSATAVFSELRKTLDSISPEEIRLEHAWDPKEVADIVEEVFRSEPDLLDRLAAGDNDRGQRG